jgi:hypothetical protein
MLEDFQITIRALDPTCADVRIAFPAVPPELEVRGKLRGPRCPGFSTVEVAYPLRRLTGRGQLYQLLIPEPSFWTPDRPFLYEGTVELWQEGQIIARTVISLGLRAENKLIV